jgi:hypothetical protein
MTVYPNRTYSWTGEPGEYKQDRTVRTGQLGKRQSGQDIPNRTARKGQPDKDSQI